MKYHFKIHKDKTGYWAECVELEGCRTQADCKSSLAKNMKEALDLYLDEPKDSTLILPLQKKNIEAKNIAIVPVSPNIAFAFYIRRLRLKRKMTQHQVAKLLGVKNVYSYQRLESSETANPALKTLVLLKKIFPKLKIDEIVS